MNDKELADKVVALGIGDRNGTAFWRTPSGHHLDAHEFVRDPRVAMALMERCLLVEIQEDGGWYAHVYAGETESPRNAHSDSLPRAIVEACVLALSRGVGHGLDDDSWYD